MEPMTLIVMEQRKNTIPIWPIAMVVGMVQVPARMDGTVGVLLRVL